MDFISLYDLMDELASNTAPKYSNSEEARYSEAAADLHQWLMSSTGRPQWLKINKNTRRPVPDNNVSDKGIAMLEHMAGWEGRTHAAYCRYRSELARAEAQGIDESLILPGINQADLMYKGADYLQAMEIGFDKKEISEFIERFKRQYSPKPETESEADQRTESESVNSDNQTEQWRNDPNLTKLEKQHKAILKAIELKSFDPMNIPDGEKETIRRICENDYPLMFDGSSSFDNAWKKGRHLFKMANHASFAKRGRQ